MSTNGILLNQNQNNNNNNKIYKIQSLSYKGEQTIRVLSYSKQQNDLYNFKIPNTKNLIDLKIFITADSVSFIPSNSAYSIGLYIGDDCLYKNTFKENVKDNFSLPITFQQIKDKEISDITLYLKGTRGESGILKNFSLNFYAYYEVEPKNSLEDIKESPKYIFNPLLLSNNQWEFIKTQWTNNCRLDFTGNLMTYLDSRRDNDPVTIGTFINKEAQWISPKSIYKANIETKYSSSPNIKFIIQDSNTIHEYDISNIEAGVETTISFDVSTITDIDFSAKKYQVGLRVYANKGTQIYFYLFSIYIE